MKITDITSNTPINEGYKLTYHEIMDLFDVIEKGRYMPVDKVADKIKNAANTTKNAAQATKNATSSAVNKVGGFMNGVRNRIDNRMKSNNKTAEHQESSLNDSIINEVGVSDMIKNMASDASKWSKREILQNKPTISANDLKKMWQQLGRPTDSDEIIRMLIHDVQMPKNMVLQALKTSSSNDPNIVAFANVVKDQGLSSQIIAACDAIIQGNNISNKQEFSLRQTNHNKRRNRNRNRNGGWGESIEPNGNVLSEKKVIPDKEIRDILTKLAIKHVQSGSSVAGTEKYVKDWATKIKSQTDAVAKMQLVKEIVNFLAGIHGTDEWKKVVHGVENIIKTDKDIQQFTKDSEDKHDDQFTSIATASLASGKTMEKKMFLLANDILSESGVSWADISLKPTLKEGTLTVYTTIKGTNIPVKQFITEMVTKKYNKELLTIGRAKKI